MLNPLKFTLNGTEYTGTFLPEEQCFEAEILTPDLIDWMGDEFQILSDDPHMNGSNLWTVHYLPREVRRVTIPACAEHEGIYFIEVNLYWFCPVCGQPRGMPFLTVSYDGSRRLHCEGWTNDCGHVDTYKDVRKEAIENGLN